jgi:hypothetical protein
MTDTPTAGARIKAATTPAPYVVSAAASAPLTTAAGPFDLVGATITITTANANAVVMVCGVFDILTASAANIAALGTCVVDGAVQPGQAIHVVVTAQARETVAQNWNVSLPTAGNHTIKFQGACVGGGSATFNMTHTTLTALVLDW